MQGMKLCHLFQVTRRGCPPVGAHAPLASGFTGLGPDTHPNLGKLVYHGMGSLPIVFLPSATKLSPSEGPETSSGGKASLGGAECYQCNFKYEPLPGEKVIGRKI